MKAANLGYKEAEDGYKVAAFLDARMKSAAAKSSYSHAQQLAADRLQMGLQACYECTEVYVTYRKQFISVKVDHPTDIIDKAGLAIREKDWENMGYVKKVTDQGITYRIPKV